MPTLLNIPEFGRTSNGHLVVRIKSSIAKPLRLKYRYRTNRNHMEGSSGYATRNKPSLIKKPCFHECHEPNIEQHTSHLASLHIMSELNILHGSSTKVCNHSGAANRQRTNEHAVCLRTFTFMGVRVALWCANVWAVWFVKRNLPYCFYQLRSIPA